MAPLAASQDQSSPAGLILRPPTAIAAVTARSSSRRLPGWKDRFWRRRQVAGAASPSAAGGSADMVGDCRRGAKARLHLQRHSTGLSPPAPFRQRRGARFHGAGRSEMTPSARLRRRALCPTRLGQGLSHLSPLWGTAPPSLRCMSIDIVFLLTGLIAGWQLQAFFTLLICFGKGTSDLGLHGSGQLSACAAEVARQAPPARIIDQTHTRAVRGGGCGFALANLWPPGRNTGGNLGRGRRSRANPPNKHIAAQLSGRPEVGPGSPLAFCSRARPVLWFL